MNFIITYWVQFLFGLLISIVTLLIKKIIDYKKILDSTTKGVRVLLKSRIIDNYNIIILKKVISLYEKEIFNDLYNEYRSLGGNGVIESLKEAIDSLPLSKED